MRQFMADDDDDDATTGKEEKDDDTDGDDEEVDDTGDGDGDDNSEEENEDEEVDTELPDLPDIEEPPKVPTKSTAVALLPPPSPPKLELPPAPLQPQPQPRPRSAPSLPIPVPPPPQAPIARRVAPTRHRTTGPSLLGVSARVAKFRNDAITALAHELGYKLVGMRAEHLVPDIDGLYLHGVVLSRTGASMLERWLAIAAIARGPIWRGVDINGNITAVMTAAEVMAIAATAPRRR
jgi:hypothetical protein